MYKDNESLVWDLNFIKSCLYDFLEGHFDEPIEKLNRYLVNPSGVPKTNDGGEDGSSMGENSADRFYMLYGKACLLFNKALLTFCLGDIDLVKNELSAAKKSAYKYVLCQS